MMEPNPTSIPPQRNTPYLLTEFGIALAAVLGNSLAIFTFVRFRALHTVTNYYIISLSTADLLVGLIAIPCAIVTNFGLPHNFHACLLTNSVIIWLCTSSGLSLVAVTIDRYWAIIHPLDYRAVMTPCFAFTIIGACWVLASILGLLPIMGWNKGRPATPECHFLQVVLECYGLFALCVCVCFMFQQPTMPQYYFLQVGSGCHGLFVLCLCVCAFYVPANLHIAVLLSAGRFGCYDLFVLCTLCSMVCFVVCLCVFYVLANLHTKVLL